MKINKGLKRLALSEFNFNMMQGRRIWNKILNVIISLKRKRKRTNLRQKVIIKTIDIKYICNTSDFLFTKKKEENESSPVVAKLDWRATSRGRCPETWRPRCYCWAYEGVESWYPAWRPWWDDQVGPLVLCGDVVGQWGTDWPQEMGMDWKSESHLVNIQYVRTLLFTTAVPSFFLFPIIFWPQ